MIALQCVYQPLQGAFGVAQVDLQQTCLLGREGTELYFLRLHEPLHFCMHDLSGRGPNAFEFLIEAHERSVGGRAKKNLGSASPGT